VTNLFRPFSVSSVSRVRELVRADRIHPADPLDARVAMARHGDAFIPCRTSLQRRRQTLVQSVLQLMRDPGNTEHVQPVP
jgi:hypothetical protein